MRTLALAVALLAASFLGGCTERDRSNPLDPANLDQGGALYGFNALAGDELVELRWNRLTQDGVLGYRLLRWRSGELPSYVSELIPVNFSGTVDTTAVNGEQYLYRLVGYLAAGDSVTSPVDTATASSRKIVVLSSALPGVIGLTPDGRDLLYANPSDDAYEDIEADDTRGVLWLSLNFLDRVERLTWTGAFAGPTVHLQGPADISIFGRDGTGWIAVPSEGRVEVYERSSSIEKDFIQVPGEPRVVEVNSTDGTVWIGTQQGRVLRYDTEYDPILVAHPLLGDWTVGGQVLSMALDIPEQRVFVATRSRTDGTADSLRIVDVRDSTVTTVAASFHNVADLAFDPVARQLWISERGEPRQGQGRLSRTTDIGLILQSYAPLEPFGIDLDEAGTCWVADLRSQRVLAISAFGFIDFWSTPMDAPYQVRVGNPPP